MNSDLKHKITQSDREMQGKRRLADLKSCEFDLKKEIPVLFNVFREAHALTEVDLSRHSRVTSSRNLEASLMQTYFAEALKREFGDKVFKGRQGRIILLVNGYVILFKKLDRNRMPMNIQTANVLSIYEQNKLLELHPSVNLSEYPILFLGYQKTKFGTFRNPQLIYIDEGKLVFSIEEQDMQIAIPLPVESKGDNVEGVKPSLKGLDDSSEAIPA